MHERCRFADLPLAMRINIQSAHDRLRFVPAPPPQPGHPSQFAVVSSPPLFSIHFMPSFSRCRAGILLSHSVYTGITINPGVGEVDQHPRRTFNYQGTVAREGKRQESFRRARPARSFESPRYRLAISLFLFLPLHPSLPLPFYSCLLFRSSLRYSLSYGARSCLLRDREDQKIPIAPITEKGKSPLVF